MTRITLLAIALLPVFFSRPTEEKLGDPLVALEKKLHGTWEGSGPCDGKLVLKSDQTYERIFYGPGGINSSGTWSLLWNALPPTLTLNCNTSDEPKHVKKSFHWKLIRLDDTALAIKYRHETKALIYSRNIKSKK